MAIPHNIANLTANLKGLREAANLLPEGTLTTIIASAEADLEAETLRVAREDRKLARARAQANMSMEMAVAIITPALEGLPARIWTRPESGHVRVYHAQGPKGLFVAVRGPVGYQNRHKDSTVAAKHVYGEVTAIRLAVETAISTWLDATVGPELA